MILERKPTFIGYLTLGDGGVEYSLEAALALVQGGVDLLEIGLPFSDPLADGPVIQEAMTRSLKRGTKTTDLIPFVEAFRKESSVPLVLFSYYNPLRAAGPEFLKAAKSVGVDGMLIIDLPFELIPPSDLDPILVVSTSTSQERLQKIGSKGKGFLYYACQKGTTGMRTELPAYFSSDIARIKKVSSLPVMAGFGISSRQIAAEAIRHADGFIVGSYFVEGMSRQLPPEQLTQLAKQIDPRRS